MVIACVVLAIVFAFNGSLFGFGFFCLLAYAFAKADERSHVTPDA